VIASRSRVSEASARATASVPWANGAFSKMPIGPFHTTVRQSASTPANSDSVSGPMSTP
jgi:hypothetical protein